MFLAPPALRRRKPHTFPAPTSIDSEMGNNLSEPARREVAAAALHLISHPQQEALQGVLNPLLQPVDLASAPHAKKGKLQCRWCIETFDRKFNKDRHEARKHAEELAAAESTQPTSSRKRTTPSEDSVVELPST